MRCSGSGWFIWVFFIWVVFLYFGEKRTKKRNFNEIGDAVQIQKNKWSNDLELTRMLSDRRAAQFSRVEPQDGFISSKNKEPKEIPGCVAFLLFWAIRRQKKELLCIYRLWIKNAKSVTKSLEICFLFSTCVFSFATPQFLNIYQRGFSAF